MFLLAQVFARDEAAGRAVICLTRELRFDVNMLTSLHRYSMFLYMPSVLTVLVACRRSYIILVNDDIYTKLDKKHSYKGYI